MLILIVIGPDSDDNAYGPFNSYAAAYEWADAKFQGKMFSIYYVNTP
jgi:hypothetical protein